MVKNKRGVRSPKVRRSKIKMVYHGRSGYPLIHETLKGRKYIMVRVRGGGTKRLYLVKGQIPKKYKEPVKHRKKK